MKRRKDYYGDVEPSVLLREVWQIEAGPTDWRFDSTTGDDLARLAAADADYSLRRVAPGVSEAWLRQVHQTVRELSRHGFGLFPSFVPADAGQTVIRHAGRICDLSIDPAGEISLSPNPTQLAAVGRALARLQAVGGEAPDRATRPDLLAGPRSALLRLAWDPTPRGRDPWQRREDLARFFGALDPAHPSVEAARAALDWLERNHPPVDLAADPPTPTLGELRPEWVRFRGDEVAALLFPDLLANRPPLGDLAAAFSSLGRWSTARCRAILDGYSAERSVSLESVSPEKVAALPALGVQRAIAALREAARADVKPSPRVLEELRSLIEIEPFAFASQVSG